MKTTTKLLIVIALILIVLISGYFAFTGYFVTTTSANYDDFAKCLTDKGVMMFGAYWCPHCQNQKNMFGFSFKYINNIECDPNGQNAQPELCKQHNIQGYPTWLINGEYYPGEMSLQTLSYLSECPLP